MITEDLSYAGRPKDHFFSIEKKGLFRWDSMHKLFAHEIETPKKLLEQYKIHRTFDPVLHEEQF